MTLDIAVVALIVTAVGVSIAGIGIILNIYFKINDRVNEMLRILSQDKFEIATEVKNLEREIKTVDVTFRKYADDMSQYLTDQFQTVNNEMNMLKTRVDNHSEGLQGQQENVMRILEVIQELQGIVRDNIR